MSGNSNLNQNQDYTVFGGWLLVWYWCLIAGGILTLAVMALPALFSIVASLLRGPLYLIGVLVSIAATGVSVALNIKAAMQMKARNAQFFDTLVLSMLVSVGGSIVSSLLTKGIVGLITGVIGGAIGFAIGMCLCVMYFSKSVRVNTYFGGRPLKQSKYWEYIQKLPDDIIADPVQNSTNTQQASEAPSQPEPEVEAQPEVEPKAETVEEK